MIKITRNSENTIYTMCGEFRTLSGSIYVLEFDRNNPGDQSKIYAVVEDQSTEQGQINKFILTESDSGSNFASIGQEVRIKAGDYRVNIYEVSTPPNNVQEITGSIIAKYTCLVQENVIDQSKSVYR